MEEQSLETPQHSDQPALQAVRLCACECGQAPAIAKKTHRHRGRVKGQPMRFVHGHNTRGHSFGVPCLDLSDRFWPKVDQSGGPDACWPWTGSLDGDGYGQISVGGKTVKANRLAWILTNGPLPAGKPVVRHVVCRNPPCCNPAHLAPGTHAENRADAVSDGTISRGQQHRSARLTEADVLEIRRLHVEEGLNYRRIARRFGVDESTVRDIVAGRTWAHVQVKHVA